MNKQIKAMPLSHWPKQVDMDVAVLRLAPEAIQQQYGIQFEEGSDDLDRFKAAVIAIDGCIFALERHLGSPDPGTRVVIASDVPDKRAAVIALLNALQLKETDLSWVHSMAGGKLRRTFVDLVLNRLRENNPLIQMIHGPRQVGKTTGVKQIQKEWIGPSLYVSADAMESLRSGWLVEQWQTALAKGPNCLLIIDEFQKVPTWSEEIKRFWDTRNPALQLRLLLLGSSSPTLSASRTETLAGRFESIYVPHWSYYELKTAFGFTFEQYLLYGGYPGAVSFIGDFDRWLTYMSESIFKPAVEDIQFERPVKNVSALVRTFEVLCNNITEDNSYRSLLSSLATPGNTDKIKHLIDLYEMVYLFKTLPKFAGSHRRLSSPKVLPLCPALHTYATRRNHFLNESERDQMLELSVGTDLMRIQDHLSYWREGHNTIDFVLQSQGTTYAIEVRRKHSHGPSGIETFRKHFPEARFVMVSADTYDSWSRDPLGYIRQVAV
jgi:predicted AAA+ superfamily ATPase